MRSRILVCLDAHLPRSGGKGEELEIPTGKEFLTALSAGEKGGEGLEEVRWYWEEGRKWKLLYIN